MRLGACSSRLAIRRSLARRRRGRCPRAPRARRSAGRRRRSACRGRARRSGRGCRRRGRARRGRRGPPRRSGARPRPSARCGVPSATILPWSMIPTRSASWSASSRYWVVRKTVTPSSRERCATSSQSAVRLWMSRPVVGSSRKRTRGAVEQGEREVEPALHPAGVAAHLAVGGVGEADPLDQLVAALLALGLRDAVEGALEAHVLVGAQLRVERGLLQGGADRVADRGALGGDVVAGDRRRCRRWRAEAWSACGPWSTCRRRWGRGSRRSRRAATSRSMPSTARMPPLNSRARPLTSIPLSRCR